MASSSLSTRVFNKLWDHTFSQWIKPESMVIQKWDSTYPNRQKKLCLFSHYDPQNMIDPYVIYYLKSIQELGFEIIFVSTSEALSTQEAEKALPYCISVISRKNIGLDFGSWKVGSCFANDLGKYEKLLLSNDSVYGPFFSLKEALEVGEKRKPDVWGMTSTLENKFHLQSYFLEFSHSTLQSPEFKKFWSKLRFYRSKRRIIKNYEIGLSTFAQKYCWKIGAFIEPHLFEYSFLNPTLFLWDQLIEKHRFPFLKTEVLKLNRAKSPKLAQWKEIIQSQSSYPVELIQNHLDRILPHLKVGPSGS